MKVNGIEVRGMTFEEMRKMSPKVTSALLGLLTENNLFGLELDPHFFMEFVAGQVHIDHNHRAIRVVFRVGNIFSTVDADSAIASGERMQTAVQDAMRNLLEDSNIYATVLVDASIL
jgi:hypothetical protein